MGAGSKRDIKLAELRLRIRESAVDYARDVAGSIQLDIQDGVGTMRDALEGMDLEEEWSAGRAVLPSACLSCLGVKLTWQAAFATELERWMQAKKVEAVTTVARQFLRNSSSRDDLN